TWSNLEGELGAEPEYAGVHIRRHVLPAGDARNERLVEAERYVVVRDVVDVEARCQPLPAEAEDLLRRDVQLPDTRPVDLALRGEVDREQAGRRQRTTDLRGRRGLI